MQKRPIRVLQIIGIFNKGGVESVVLNYYRHINRDKIQFDFVVHDNTTVDVSALVEPLGGRVYKVPAYNKNIWGFMKGVYNIVKHHNYKIIHSHMTTLSVFSLGPAWLAGAKIRILHAHNTTVSSEYFRNIIKLMLRPFSIAVANHYFACSQLVAQWMYGDIFRKIIIINNAVDLKKFAFNRIRRNILRRELGLENSFVIGHVGRFVYQKNHEYLIHLLAFIMRTMSDVKLVLIGDGPLRERILNLIHTLNMDDRVLYLGVRHDVDDLYNIFDVVYLPSWYEGLAVVSVEAQANGLPILMSKYVTEEACIDKDLSYRIGVGDDDMEKWLEMIQSIREHSQWRGIQSEVLQKKGFDISQKSAELEALYEMFFRY